MDALLGKLELIILSNVDISKPLSQNVETAASNAAFVHCGNILPYLLPEAMYQSIFNTLKLTSSQGGILRFHNDDSLPIDNILFSVTLHRNGNMIEVLQKLTKVKDSL
jgi:hypothetical protein